MNKFPISLSADVPNYPIIDILNFQNSFCTWVVVVNVVSSQNYIETIQTMEMCHKQTWSKIMISCGHMAVFHLFKLEPHEADFVFLNPDRYVSERSLLTKWTKSDLTDYEWEYNWPIGMCVRNDWLHRNILISVYKFTSRKSR